ncbi:MAG TPA: TonB-dependent receptor [Vicinamibacterales bacterium]
MNRHVYRHSAFVALVAVCSLLLLAPANAQEFRGSISGRVADATKAIIPGATVTARNIATNVTATSVTNAHGVFNLSYLQPGEYEVDVELMGFRKEARRVQVQIADRLELNFELHPGGLTETIEVRAETQLLQTESGSLGQIVDERRVSSLPLGDGNPFVLSRLAPGTVFFGDLKFARPFDNSGTSAIASAGAPGGNEFTLDGAPNTGNRTTGEGWRVAYVPPSDAVQEFKVETTTFDAQQGHTAGATVNVALKSGTNALKGTAYAFLRNDKLASNDFFLEKAGKPKADMSYYRWGGTAGGPVRRDKTFFFASYERLNDRFPEPDQFTVPTDAMRRGDLSYLLPLGIQIYDPFTAKKQGSVIVRQPFKNNVIPLDRISPVALAYMKYFPAPNQAGDSQGRNNFSSPQLRTDAFNSFSGRVDHTLTDKQRVFVRYVYNQRHEERSQWSGAVNGIVPTGNNLYRTNYGISADHTYTITSSTLLNVRGGWSRFEQHDIRPSQGNVDMASLGFSAQTVGQLKGISYLPRFQIGDVSDLGNNWGSWSQDDIFSAQATMTKIFGNHSVRAGYDVRRYREFSAAAGNPGGQWNFTADYTRATSSSSSAPIGQKWAAFLLGLPNGNNIDIDTDSDARSWYHAMFVQDDWRVSPKLTLNVGLRYDYELAPLEIQNRNIRGFDPNAAQAIAPAVQTAYAASPIPERPASDFKVQGGLQYTSADNPRFWNPDKTNFQPRAGFAYRIDEKTVLRGGIGLYSMPFVIDGVQQYGYAQSTQISVTPDSGLTFNASAQNPWPGGLLQPAGNSQGVATYLGRSITFTPTTRKTGRSLRWAVSLQRELRGSWVVEASYVANRGYDQKTSLDMNAIPAQFLSTSQVRDQAVIDQLSRNVTNPFVNQIPGVSLNSKTVQANQLLRAYPQFTGVTGQLYDGTTQYDSVLLNFTRRFAKGYSVDVNYTFSRLREDLLRLNATDPNYQHNVGRNDTPHRVAGSFVWELPFKASHKVVNGLVAGWSVNAAFQIQRGRPITDTLGNLYFNGDPNSLKVDWSQARSGLPVFDTTGFYFADAAVQTNGVVDPAKQRNDSRISLSNNVRTFPQRIDGLRTPLLNEWNISFIKRTPLKGRMRLEFRAEVLNAFNQIYWGGVSLDPKSSNFGIATSQDNLPREFQVAVKLVF